MRYALIMSVFLITSAHAQGTGDKITGPEAAPLVPEAATDIPIRAPGPATGAPVTTTQPGGTQATPPPGPLEPEEAVKDSSRMPGAEKK